MITKKEIKKLSLLARISASEKETKELQKDLEKILNFVSKLEKAELTSDAEKPLTSDAMNVFREDKNPHKKTGHSEALLKQAPEIEKGYIKTRKVL